MNTLAIAETINCLKTTFPYWHFEPYGQDGAIACFPPSNLGQCSDTYRALSRVAPITSVGPLYVVTHLRDDFLEP